MLIFGSRGRNQGSQRIEESMATVPAGSPSPSALLYPSTFHTVLTPLSYVACSSRVLRVLSHCRWHYDLISFGVFEVVRRACITATSLHYAVARGGNWTGAPSPNSLISLLKPKQYHPLLHLSPVSPIRVWKSRVWYGVNGSGDQTGDYPHGCARSRWLR